MYLVPETSTLKWLFQFDDSKPLLGKWLFHQTSIKKQGCLGFQVFLLSLGNIFFSRALKIANLNENPYQLRVY